MNDKKKTSGRAKTHKEPVVKEVKVSEPVNEDEDKKLIVVIAVAILIIIGTVIGLLVGCQKEENENKTDDNETKIIEPDSITDDTKEDDAEKYNVVRTTSSTTTTKYQITYILDGEKVYSTNIASGKKISKYTPSGYEKCSYFGDSELSEKFDFSKVPEDDTKVYLVCTLKEYTVTYKDSDGSTISSETLKGSDTEGYKVEGNSKEGFLGWSKNASSTVKYKAGQIINVNENLTLTAVYGVTTVKYESAILKEVYVRDRVMPTSEVDEEGNIIPGTEYMPTEEEKMEMFGNETMTIPEFIDEVEVGYTQEEVDNYTLPSDPSEVGLETPTYFVPVDGETDTSKRIVSDDEEEIGDRQVRLGDVEGRTPDWYTPAVDDNVEEKDCNFVGWVDPGMDPVPSDYKPSTSEGDENHVIAAYEIPEEDQQPPAASTPAPEPEPEAPAAEEVVEG